MSEKIREFRNYKKPLFKRLQNPKEAAAYLDAAFQDKDPKVFLIALKDVAEATFQLWVNLITLEETESTSSSVEAQSMQGSVSDRVDLSSAGSSEKN